MHLLLFMLAQFIVPPPKAPAEVPKTKAVMMAEKKVIKLIKALPEVLLNNQYSLKKYKLPLDIEVDRNPTKERNDYQVSVYLPRPDIEKRNNLYYFFVDAKSYAIFVWDVAAYKTWSLAAWRRHMKVQNREYEKKTPKANHKKMSK